MLIREIDERLGDWMLSWPLIEQAMQRNEAEQKIKDKSGQVVIHLVKILKWQDPNSYLGHITSINSWLWSIQNYEVKQKRPLTADVYYDWTCLHHIKNANSVEKIIKGLMPSYRKLPDNGIKTGDMATMICSILRDVSYDIEKDNFADIEPYIKNYIDLGY